MGLKRLIKIMQQNKLFENDISIKEKESILIGGIKTNRIYGEFWTSKQRQASSLQEISYRACFKPQLPRYFIQKYTSANEIVYDPFAGRGTTTIEAGLLGRKVIQNDINPLSIVLSKPRLYVPTFNQISERLSEIKISASLKSTLDLSMFFEKETLNEILCLRHYFKRKVQENTFDNIDSWIQMVATNRLTGHSPGFFSVYTFPPNQAVSQASQIKINQKRKQQPTYKDTKKLILKKTQQLQKSLSTTDINNLRNALKTSLFLTNTADQTPEIKSDSVSLIVTSPPFLDVVDYKDDNWLRTWFNDINSDIIGKQITMSKTVEKWSEDMQKIFHELTRVLKKGGQVAFEVGEVKAGKIKLDEIIVPLGVNAGLSCDSILINTQDFTKTSNIWGVKNNQQGTNTNRIVVFIK
jgi:tRNA G10  N-methylase Trm11